MNSSKTELKVNKYDCLLAIRRILDSRLKVVPITAIHMASSLPAIAVVHPVDGAMILF